MTTANEEELAVSSWDHSSTIYTIHNTAQNILSKKSTLQGHTAPVWATLAYRSTNHYITASADKSIKIWNGEKCTKTVMGHTDVVRSLCKVPTIGFLSASNDNSVILWDEHGNQLTTLIGHTAFVYQVAALTPQTWFSVGEDRSLRIWRGTA